MCFIELEKEHYLAEFLGPSNKIYGLISRILGEFNRILFSFHYMSSWLGSLAVKNEHGVEYQCQTCFHSTFYNEIRKCLHEPTKGNCCWWATN